MKISASIYSNKQKPLEELVLELDAHGIDMLHVDCRDDDFVLEDLEKIRSISKTPIDLHIISSTPEKYFPAIEKLGIEYVSFQYENLNQLPQLNHKGKTQYGLSITSGTSIEVFEKAKNDYSFIVMMSTVPGKSGGIFNRSSFQKIIEFKYLYPRIKVHVDGGVNDEIGYILRLLGVNTVVTGSYLMNHESIGIGLLSFHKTLNSTQNFKVSEFAVPVSYLPVLKQDQLNFIDTLVTIENYGLGFALITDELGRLNGIISHADIRRGLIRNIENLNNVDVKSIINTIPVSINEENTVSDIIKLLNELNFIVLFLPVVTKNNMLTGVVLLNNLTRV
ncbi:MAG: CBS domain-containing protein [Chitinophagales bacterium]